MDPSHPPWLKDPAHRWRPGTLDRTRLLADVDALARGDGFDAIAQRFARLWLGTQAAHPSLRAVFRNTARYLLLVSSVVMHHRRDPSDPRSGITSSRVQEFFSQDLRGTLATSASQVKAMLAHARLHELLQPVAGAGDSRYRPLEPSPRLIGILQDWVQAFLVATEGVDALPLPASPQAMATRPGLVGEVFSYRIAALTEDGFILWQGIDALKWVIRRDYGYRVFLHMVAAMVPEPDGSMRVPLTVTELAHRAGATRGTVRNLLADASALGWFERGDSPADGWRLRAADLDVVRHWIARELVWMHGLARAAYAALDARQAPTSGGR